MFVGKNVLSDQLALLAITSVWSWLYRAYKDGGDIEAREHMMLASLAAGCAFGTAGTAAAHAIQYPVGNDTHTAHGTGVALLLPYVMEYNRMADRSTYATIARTVGLDGPGKSDAQLLLASRTFPKRPRFVRVAVMFMRGTPFYLRAVVPPSKLATMPMNSQFINVRGTSYRRYFGLALLLFLAGVLCSTLAVTQSILLLRWTAASFLIAAGCVPLDLQLKIGFALDGARWRGTGDPPSLLGPGYRC